MTTKPERRDRPLVSFVVPCYNLARYLRPCVESILNQTYPHLDVLIMDDCSPDETPFVAASFNDGRVRHVRNERNLGHLRNYNKGTGMVAGDYVWLISADDALRVPDAVERYVSLMEQHPRLAYVFCAAMGLDGGGVETGVVEWTCPWPADRIVEGRRFLQSLAGGNRVCASSVMTRRGCYEFPLDLPHVGDWYLWCSLALQGDVGYLAEPMVYYRTHADNMSATVFSKRALVRADWIKGLGRVKGAADAAGLLKVSERCAEHLALHCALGALESGAPHEPDALVGALDTALMHASAEVRGHMRSRSYRVLAEQLLLMENFSGAVHFYRKALLGRSAGWRCAAKLLILSMGRPGRYVWKTARRYRGVRTA